ncbi:MAG: single-stranded-DNA-specific exonuclease RecJ [Candidatus Levybacteria bacterium]|nr:single-stranded-DNA-specific exonuclease RecJ [Candidatus Levybacteria bacterium]
MTQSIDKRWEIASSVSIHSVQDIISTLLLNRGLKSKKDRDTFLHPTVEIISLESVGVKVVDIKKTISRLKKAHKNQELVVVYGDYDVDGIAGTAILWESLIKLGFKSMPYIPHRVEEGYGLSEKGILGLKAQMPDASLIITVDNGIVANDAVEFAKKESIDVIITDHHLAEKNNLPNAFSLIHTTKLCGGGVAWLLSKRLQSEFSFSDDDMSDSHLELAALATVADLVPLKDENRAILLHGLQKIHTSKRIGLMALIEQAGISQKDVGVYEIGHIIAPRLNAAGRIESAMDSLRLLCTRDKKRAKVLAEKLDLTNKERQLLTFSAAKHASEMVRSKESLKKILIIVHDNYEEGIIGLVAGRLVEEFYRPSIVISKGVEKSKGSVRSVSGFNVIEFLRSKPHLFINLGGHPMAAGFTIHSNTIDEFVSELEDSADTLVLDDMLQRSIKIDIEIPFQYANDELYQNIKTLSPFGIGNPEPIFLSKHILVREKRLLGKDGKHMRLVLQEGDGGNIVQAVAFGLGDRINQVPEDGYIDVVYSLRINEWNGVKKLQLMIKDFH